MSLLSLKLGMEKILATRQLVSRRIGMVEISYLKSIILCLGVCVYHCLTILRKYSDGPDSYGNNNIICMVKSKLFKEMCPLE